MLSCLKVLLILGNRVGLRTTFSFFLHDNLARSLCFYGAPASSGVPTVRASKARLQGTLHDLLLTSRLLPRSRDDVTLARISPSLPLVLTVTALTHIALDSSAAQPSLY